ncbi:tetratricopeptide repeat protein [Hazenella sp. IB182353]|uniref:tetratricopeptide repeat protein n=1 Tax=Polycladospora coralii TaxID=2771432 RepID=UPI001747B0CE|nr:tetratricopeptide repeat protein [Polycladospora coralii]MBS7531657.1 tetratricopeptide repeat protein [Polycladospora coralii]
MKPLHNGTHIGDGYQILRSFPFIEGILYFTVKDQHSFFIHAIDRHKKNNATLKRDPRFFVPIRHTFEVDQVYYHVLTQLEGDLFAFYLQQYAPFAMSEAKSKMEALIVTLSQMKKDGLYAHVHPQNMLLQGSQQLRFLYGGDQTAFSQQIDSRETVWQLASLLYTYLTGEWITPDKPPKPIHQLRPEVPSDLATLLDGVLREKKEFLPDYDAFIIAMIQAWDDRNTSAALSRNKKKRKFTLSPRIWKKPAVWGSFIAVFLFGCLAFFLTMDNSLTADPEKSAASWYHDSQIEVEKNQLDHAIELGKKAVETDPKLVYFTHLSNLYKSQQKYDKSIEILTAATEHYPTEGILYYDMAKIKYYLKDYKTATVYIEKAIELQKDKDSNTLHLQGRIFSAQQKYEQAIASLSKAIQLEPNKDSHYHERAISLYRSGQLDKALVDEDKAIQIDPTVGMYYLTRGIIYIEKRQQTVQSKDEDKKEKIETYTKKSLDAFNETVKLIPEDPDAYYYQGLAYYYSRKYDPALTAINQAIELDGNHALYHYQKGLILNEMNGKVNEAIHSLKKATSIDPNSTIYQNALLRVQKKAK